jgi:DNA-directed RNA polymerase specialized sigma24 family protein
VSGRYLYVMTSLALDSAMIASAVERAIAGDELAFARIVGAYHLDLVRVAYVICGDEDLAEDGAQAAWWIAWRKLASLRDPERLKPWLVAVAANEARKLVGREHRHGIVELKVAADPSPRPIPASITDWRTPRAT